MPSVTTLTVHDAFLEVVWEDGSSSSYPWAWLRDHGHDEQTRHPVTQQRQIHATTIRPDLRARSATVVGDEVTIDLDVELIKKTGA